MVVPPSAPQFAALLTALPGTDSYDGGDTGFLNRVFSDWFSAPGDQRLPFGYNAQRTMHAWTAKRPGYWQAVQPLTIVHYCSSPKPVRARALRSASSARASPR
jgi:glycogenin glucosyltransferase